METRSQARGAPLKKPGAYNTDLYYQEKDQGFGDVGVDQEPDAGQVDDREDPDYKVEGRDLEAADQAAAAEDQFLPAADRADVEDLKNTRATEDVGEGDVEDEQGEPVPVVQESAEEREAMDAVQPA